MTRYSKELDGHLSNFARECPHPVGHHQHHKQASSPGLHCHSTLSLTAVDCHSLVIHTLILLSFSVKVTVFAPGYRQGMFCARNVVFATADSADDVAATTLAAVASRLLWLLMMVRGAAEAQEGDGAPRPLRSRGGGAAGEPPPPARLVGRGGTARTRGRPGLPRCRCATAHPPTVCDVNRPPWWCHAL